jgi:hypothetical protein
MTIDELDDQLLRDLHRVSVLTPDQARLERVRARCHAAIARRQLQAERSARRARFRARVLEPALVGGFCLTYLVGVFYNVLQFKGIL